MQRRPPDWSMERCNVQVSLWEEETEWHGVRWKLIVTDTTVRAVDRSVICLMDNLSEELYQVTTLAELMREAQLWVEGRKVYWAERAIELGKEIERQRRKRVKAEERRVKRLRTRYVDYYE